MFVALKSDSDGICTIQVKGHHKNDLLINTEIKGNGEPQDIDNIDNRWNDQIILHSMRGNYVFEIKFKGCELSWSCCWFQRDARTLWCVCRQQMQQVGSSTTDSFLLHHLNSSDCGSETSAEPRKSKARAQKEVSVGRAAISSWSSPCVSVNVSSCSGKIAQLEGLL